MRTLFFSLFILGFSLVSNAQATLTEADNNTSITIEKGERLIISLKNHGGTPYQWKMTDNGENVLVFEKEATRKEEQPKGAIPMTGTPYFTDYYFTGTNVGTGRVTLKLVSYSGEVAKTMQYSITVKEVGMQVVPAPILLGEENNGVTLSLSGTKEKGTFILVSLKNQSGTPFMWKVVSYNEEVTAFQTENRRTEEETAGGAYFTDFDLMVTGKKGVSELKFQLTSYAGEVEREISYTITVK